MKCLSAPRWNRSIPVAAGTRHRSQGARPSLVLSQPSWSCYRCRIRGGARAVAIAIAAAVGEALPAANAAPFPAKGATGLASNPQAWLRESRLQSPRHCSPGQRMRRSAVPRCPPREGSTEGVRRHAWLRREGPDRGHAPTSWPRRDGPTEGVGAQACLAAARDALPLSRSRSRSSLSLSCRYLVAVAVAVAVVVA
jgi:hypothetical protein